MVLFSSRTKDTVITNTIYRYFLLFMGILSWVPDGYCFVGCIFGTLLCLIVGRRVFKQNVPGKNYQDFLKRGEGGRGGGVQILDFSVRILDGAPDYFQGKRPFYAKLVTLKCFFKEIIVFSRLCPLDLCYFIFHV